MGTWEYEYVISIVHLFCHALLSSVPLLTLTIPSRLNLPLTYLNSLAVTVEMKTRQIATSPDVPPLALESDKINFFTN